MSGLLARAGGVEPPFSGLHARPSSPSRPPGVYNTHIGREIRPKPIPWGYQGPQPMIGIVSTGSAGRAGLPKEAYRYQFLAVK